MDYDRWKLASPYEGQELPPDIEDLIGQRVWVEEEDAWGTVEEAEPWSDVDEESGHVYGGWDFIVVFAGRRHTMSQIDLEEAISNNPS